VNVERTSYWLAAGGGVIEASFDRGAIEANGDKLGIREFELELKSGGQRALFNFARALVSQAPLHPSFDQQIRTRPSSRRGHLGPRGERSKPRLAKDMTCGQAFQEISQTCLRDFHLNLLGLEKLDNAERFTKRASRSGACVPPWRF